MKLGPMALLRIGGVRVVTATRKVQAADQAIFRHLGVEPKNGPEGLVDFPAVLDGRPVYLCWKLGEPEVLHWHDLDAGFRGRQPLTAGSAAGGSGSTDTIGG